MKLTDNIYLVGGGEPDLIFTDQMDCNIYLIRSEEFYILVDAVGGQAVDKIIENISAYQKSAMSRDFWVRYNGRENINKIIKNHTNNALKSILTSPFIGLR